jgi:photosystem II stability/assembly factor-like uncharacterized protein
VSVGQKVEREVNSISENSLHPIIFTSSGGTSWSNAAYSNTDNSGLSAVALAGNNGVAVGYSTAAGGQMAIYRSSNTGANWEAVTSLPSSANIDLSSVLYSEGQWIMVGNNVSTFKVVIYRSTDNGATWTATSAPSDDSGNLLTIAAKN